MVPLILLLLTAVVLVAAVLGVASGRIPVDPMPDAVRSTPDPGLPHAPSAADVDAVRFDTALRGYRMDEVDARMDELQRELAERERVLETLRPADAVASPPADAESG